jgi:hypothetical protein
MARERFAALLAPVIDVVRDRTLDDALKARLEAHLPANGEAFLAIERACHAAIAAGWMCTEGGGQRRFGRIFEPSAALGGFSVDVVDITELVGNHHRHPTGEIDMIMPVTPGARFRRLRTRLARLPVGFRTSADGRRRTGARPVPAAGEAHRVDASRVSQ